MLALTATCLLSSCAQIETNAAAPALNALDIEGAEVDLDMYKGAYVVLDFWASWCGPCHRELPKLMAAYPALSAAGVNVISIAVERNAERGKQFSEQKNFPWEQQIIREARFLALDEIAANYGISEIPTAVIIDPDGAVVSYHSSVQDLLENLKRLGAY
jgi:thiol-disulfide isomerase/thioredoxin